MSGMFFEKILQMSLIGSYSMLVVLLIRCLLMKMGRKYAYYLWVIVFLNLCVPISFKGPVSLIPGRVANLSYMEQVQPMPADGSADKGSEVSPQIVVLPLEGTVYEGEITQAEEADAMTSGQRWGRTAEVSLRTLYVWLGRIWFAGMCLFLLYSGISAFRLNCRIRNSFGVWFNEKDRIAELEGIHSPFLWGFFHPTIYLPNDMEAGERTYIIAHEICHRKRKDHLVKIAIYMVTIFHWFNPLVWLAYSLCCKDMEISCDEAVLEHLGKSIRKAYAKSLLKYAAKQNGYAITPLTFGEPSVRSRIEHVLRYRKKGIAVSVLSIVLTILVAAGLLTRPKDSDKSGTEQERTREEADEGAEPLAGENTADFVQVVNNGGEVIRVGDRIYYMDGKELYSDGEQLYTSRQDDAGTWWIWRYKLDGSGYERLMEGRILGTRDEKAYILRQEPNGLYIDCIYSDGTEELNILKQEILEEEITSFYASDDYLMFAAGHMEGSIGNFVGNFYSYDLVKGILISEHLTDAGEFMGADAHIYYQKYFNPGDGGNELYRTDVRMSEEKQVGEGLELLAIDQENGRLLAARDGQLLSTQVDGSAEELVFDVIDIGWERTDGDHIRFSEVNMIDDAIYIKAEQWGYTGDHGWRDSLLQSQYIYIKADGSDFGGWDPESLLAGQEEATAYLYDAVPGVPCENPSKNGWALEQWKDLRKQFSNRSYVPDPGTLDWTYLLENTEHYTLYGSGDYERMLLEYEGQYAEIRYPYTSNYMIPVDMVESDFDGDGTPELAMKLNIKHGTGIYIDTFFMADLADDGLYVYQFLENDIIAQFDKHLSYVRTEHGLQALVDGENAGTVLEDIPGQKPYDRVSIGNQIRFYLGDERVHVSALLEFYTDDTQDFVFDCNDYDVRALVSYQDGGEFVLTEYESRNTAVEAVARAAAEDFYTGDFRIVDIRYDVHDTGGHATVVILPRDMDSYDYLDMELEGDWGNWTVKNLYLEK